MNVFHRYTPLIGSITPSGRILVAIALLMLAENGLALCSPWLAGQLTSSILAETPVLSISYKQIIILWFVIVLFQSGLGYASRMLSGTTGERMLVQLRNLVYNHLQSLPLAYHHDNKHGETLALLTNDSRVVSRFITETMLSMVPQVLTAIGAIVCIGLINPLIAGLTTILLPLFYLAIKLIGRNIRPISKKMMAQYAATFSLAEENLATISVIKIFTREKIEAGRFHASNTDLFDRKIEYLRARTRLTPLIKLMATGIVLSILWIIGEDISAGRLSTGEIVSLILYGLLLTRPISQLADTYGQIQNTAGAADRLADALTIAGEDLEEGKELPQVRGAISFHDVCFSYPGREPILNNLNLDIPAGETLAITGDNGAGKSTLTLLLLRLYNPQSGSILIDGEDVGDISLQSLRDRIGLVEQNVLLHNSSITDNICFGRPESSEKEIRRAAKAAYALEFIEALPSGFDTIIGDQGIKLSGGQKQRLSLARALLTDPKVLILDEATAMFDPQGELAFIEENRQLLSSRTVIIITHRPASLALADRILRLDQGIFSEYDPSAIAIRQDGGNRVSIL